MKDLTTVKRGKATAVQDRSDSLHAVRKRSGCNAEAETGKMEHNNNAGSVRRRCEDDVLELYFYNPLRIS